MTKIEILILNTYKNFKNKWSIKRSPKVSKSETLIKGYYKSKGYKNIYPREEILILN